MSSDRCPVCRAHPASADRYVCSHCTKSLRANLIDLPDRMEALQAAIGNQLQFGPQYREGGVNADANIPYNQQASKVAQTAKHAILMWTHHTAQARQEFTPVSWQDVMHFLDVRAHWIATQAAGPDAYRDLGRALRSINLTIDRPRYRRIPLHVPCTHRTVEDEQCAGSYEAIIDNDNTGWATIPDLTCTVDSEHIITPAGFRTLRRTLDPEALDTLLHR